jgi:hypothetical protein
VPGFYERFDSDGNNTKYGAGADASKICPKHRQSHRLDDETEESEVSTVRLSYGVSQTTYPAMGLRGLQLH